VVATNNTKELLLIDVSTWTIVAALQDRVPNHAWHAAFIDNRRFAFCGADAGLELWDGQGKPSKLATLAGGADDCQTIAVDRDRGHIALGGYHGGVPPFELHVFGVDGSLLGKRKIPGPFEPALSGDWFTGLDDDSINAPSHASRTFVEWSKDAAATKAPPAQVSFAGLGNAEQILAMAPNGILGLIDTKTGARHELGHEHGVPRTGVWSQDGLRLFVFFQADGAHGTSGIATFELPGLKEIHFEPEGWASDYIVAANGRWILASDSADIVFFDAKTGQKIVSAPTSSSTRR
jgi:hypothetical protein